MLEDQPGEADCVPKPEDEFHVLERESVRFHWEQMLSSPRAPGLAADGPVGHVFPEPPYPNTLAALVPSRVQDEWQPWDFRSF